jgi:hypothetical protein
MIVPETTILPSRRNNPTPVGFHPETAWRLIMSNREEIAPNGDKRYIRRDDEGRIESSVEEGRSLSDDARRKAKHDVKPGQGDRGDHHSH